MIRRSRPHKYNYGRKLEPEPEDEEPKTILERVKRLPMPGPGIKIPIPLDLYPAYMELYGLEEIGYRGDVMFYRRTKKEGMNAKMGNDIRDAGKPIQERND